jgi:hypothetical protein
LIINENLHKINEKAIIQTLMSNSKLAKFTQSIYERRNRGINQNLDGGGEGVVLEREAEEAAGRRDLKRRPEEQEILRKPNKT